MPREELLISLLKTEQNIVELRRSKDNNTEMKETKNSFNELRNRFSKEKIEKIRKKFCFREDIGEYLKELEENKTKKNKPFNKTREKNYIKKLKKTEEFLKKLKEDLNRLEKHQYHDNDDLDYKGIRQIENLFDEIN